MSLSGSAVRQTRYPLRPGVSLRGGTLCFGAKGIRLSSDNVLEDVTVIVPASEVAILNDTSVSDLGRLTLRNVRTRGQVLLLADGLVSSGHVEVDGLVVASADVRGRPDRQHGFGVDALQGAFTLWNRQLDPAVRITARLTGVSAGSKESPIRGSGVFVAGHGDWSGRADGSLASARFQSITTHGDGAVGIQVSKDLPVLDITDSVTTFGGQGTSLVRGKQTQLSAIAVSIMPGGRIGRLAAGGPLSTHGDQVVTLDVQGALGELKVQHGITASGVASDAVRLTGEIPGLNEITVTAAHGQAIARLAGGQR
jgi:hypothetical protein